jgi:hypothetical protein
LSLGAYPALATIGDTVRPGGSECAVRNSGRNE